MTLADVRVLVVQDRLNTYGGGERVVKHLTDILPGETDVVTGDFDPSSTYEFSAANIREVHANSFRSFVTLRLEIDWTEYDAVLFSGNRPQFTVWLDLPIPTIRYCHSPTRLFWALRDRRHRNATRADRLKRTVIAPTYRHLDRWLNQKHTSILTNSHNVRSQVERFYGLDARVVYPPVDTATFQYRPHDDYWLSVNRLVPKKRVNLQLDAFTGTDEQLIIIGSVDDQFDSYGKSLCERAAAMPNVTLKRSVSESELISLYANCKGVVYTPIFEDFGLVPVEAMASGKPVVAVAEGGPVETVQHGYTGWLVEATAADIRDAVTCGFNTKEYRDRCFQQSKRFDVSIFAAAIRDEIKRIIR